MSAQPEATSRVRDLTASPEIVSSPQNPSHVGESRPIVERSGKDPCLRPSLAHSIGCVTSGQSLNLIMGFSSIICKMRTTTSTGLVLKILWKGVWQVFWKQRFYAKIGDNRRTQEGSLRHCLGPVVLMFFLDQPAVCLFFLPLHFSQMAKASSTPPPPQPSPCPKGSIFPGQDLTRKNERLGIAWWGRLLSEGLHSWSTGSCPRYHPGSYPKTFPPTDGGREGVLIS